MVFKALINMQIPDVVLLILIVWALIWIFLVNKRFQSIPSENIKKMPKKIRILGEKIPIREESLYLLGILADERDLSMTESDLWEKYHKKYPDKKRRTFSIVFEEMKENALIYQAGINNETIYKIDNDGLRMLRRYETI